MSLCLPLARWLSRRSSRRLLVAALGLRTRIREWFRFLLLGAAVVVDLVERIQLHLVQVVAEVVAEV